MIRVKVKVKVKDKGRIMMVKEEGEVKESDPQNPHQLLRLLLS